MLSVSEFIDWRRFFELRADWRAAGLVAIFALVIAGALALRPALVATGTESAVSGSSTAAQAGAGVAWAAGEAVFAGILLVGIFLFRRVTEWLRRVVSRTIRAGFWMLVAVYISILLGPVHGLLTAALLFGIVEAAKELDGYWIINDVLAISLAIVAGAAVGITLGPIVLAAGLVGLSIYDYWFADREEWMFSLLEWTARWKFPALVVVPTALRFDWDLLTEATDEDVDLEAINWGFGIGMADLFLPAAFAVGLANTGGSLPVYGAVAGVFVACFRMSAKESGAGLPPITSGALGGWAVATLLVVAL